ncbi:hypothetical protein D9M72_172950 [compost metagenome]
MIELQYLHALVALAIKGLKSRASVWLLWKLLPADVVSVQLFRMGPALMTGDELRLSTAPETIYRGTIS